MKKSIVFTVLWLTGLGLIFIGARFLLSPEVAEAGFGLRFNEQGDYSFHYIKGARDIFSGLLICLLILNGQHRALAIALLAATIVPFTDLLMVLSKPYNGISKALPHITAIVIAVATGLILLLEKKRALIKTPDFLQLVNEGDAEDEDVFESAILPGEHTPWHYHTLFAETFEVIKGTMEAGKNKDVVQLRPGDTITIQPQEHHYYNNTSDQPCIVRSTIRPRNIDFRHSLFILKGLAKDGQAGASGIPKKLADLALFVQLNNSKMVGASKIAAPLFGWLARRAIRNGRLKELEDKYC